MTAWEYHNKKFSDDLNRFFESLFKGPRGWNVGDGIVRDPKTSFHVEDLSLENSNIDHLSKILYCDLAFFATSLTYVVLINQIVHAHFSNIHDKFLKITKYPLVAGGMNPTRSPYDILDKADWDKRNISHNQLKSAWIELTSFIYNDIHFFETEQAPHLGLTWEKFRISALKDNGVIGPEPWGGIIYEAIYSKAPGPVEKI